MAKITSVDAREIIDSRGDPTVETEITLDDGSVGTSSVPSGASKGKYEAHELRDGDSQRYAGLGVLKAVTNIKDVIAPKILGLDVRDQLTVDKTMLLLDGTSDKSTLGSNAILSVSQAACKAAAAFEKVPLYEHVSHLSGLPRDQFKVPIPIFNLINGGKHGAGNLDFQEFHIVPSSQKTFSQSLQAAEEIYQITKKILIRHNAVHSVGDEGGFAPNLFTNGDALEILTQAIKESPYHLNQDVFLSLDVATSYFYKNNKYMIKDRTVPMGTNELVDFYLDLIKQYPLLLLEDPLDEDDWESWSKLTALLGNIIVVADDLVATNKARIEEAIKRKACTGVLIKPNQIGTIAETIEVIKITKLAGLKVIVSHRSGETNDDFIADFAVGVGADFTKFGAPARGERIAKYNRLLSIEKELHK